MTGPNNRFATGAPPGRRGDWEDDANCRTVDPDIFFSDEAGNLAQAREVCGACPVIAQCGAFAGTNHIRYGIWGGVNPKARSGLRA